MASTLPDHPRISPDLPPRPAAPPQQERGGRVEVHGIDHIPQTERRGRARELFPP
ncbi:hypothetical protein ACFWJ4_08110 [Kitasatospora sp. NPDC127067]|uniref:hypothetical protein n=1 Tax=Kitasatospora sp. NPDC127067 TaxID=3347126 RepID=UPI003653B9C9